MCHKKAAVSDAEWHIIFKYVVSIFIARGYKKATMELDTVWKDRGIRKTTQYEIGESAHMGSHCIRSRRMDCWHLEFQCDDVENTTVINMKTMLSSTARTKISVINEDFGDKRPTKAMLITRAKKTVVETRKVGKSVKATIIGDLIKQSYYDDELSTVDQLIQR